MTWIERGGRKNALETLDLKLALIRSHKWTALETLDLKASYWTVALLQLKEYPGQSYGYGLRYGQGEGTAR